ncbi:MAG: VOC family protein [Burkholderiales bacterium]|nr:VOC family protein [Burkholderiales bacterium]
MKSNPVVHFEIYVQDMNRAKAFYEGVLGIKLEKMPAPTPEMDLDMWFFPYDPETGMSTYGAGGALVKMDGFSPGSGGTLVYFGCDDCAVPAARAAAHGGSLCKEKTSIGQHGFYALAQDTEGNTIGFHSMA